MQYRHELFLPMLRGILYVVALLVVNLAEQSLLRLQTPCLSCRTALASCLACCIVTSHSITPRQCLRLRMTSLQTSGLNNDLTPPSSGRRHLPMPAFRHQRRQGGLQALHCPCRTVLGMTTSNFSNRLSSWRIARCGIDLVLDPDTYASRILVQQHSSHR